MQIEISQAATPEDQAAILVPLAAHNKAMTGRTDTGALRAVFLRNAQGAIEGGLWGWYWYGWFKLEFAFIPEHRRRERLGARMLAVLEAEAVRLGATGLWMQSFSFQAPGFYEKLGYRRIGVIEDLPPGFHDVFLAKTEGFATAEEAAATGLSLAVEPSKAECELINAALRSYSDGFAGPSKRQNLAIVVRDESHAIIGGLWGRSGRGWMFVDMLGLPPEARGTGLGTKLLGMAETEARARGCIGIWLDTFSFQARPFYERLGYTVFAEIADYPPGHTRYFLSKRLDAA